ncbi:MAG: PilZ domain-containing protein [Candidatus Omnitrophota bacterium]|jgi:c-di-GMP-binding flagellar brake protein YcgR
MQEKRKFKRLATGKETLVKEQSGKEKKAVVVDISLGGMRITLEEEAKVGNCLSGQFKILPGMGPFYVNGEVIWVNPLKKGDLHSSYDVGIKFKNISAVPLEA